MSEIYTIGKIENVTMTEGSTIAVSSNVSTPLVIGGVIKIDPKTGEIELIGDAKPSDGAKAMIEFYNQYKPTPTLADAAALVEHLSGGESIVVDKYMLQDIMQNIEAGMEGIKSLLAAAPKPKDVK